MSRPLFDPVQAVRPEVRDLKAYHLELQRCRFKLDQNEVPFDLPRVVKERAVSRLLADDWSRYPDFHSDELRRALGSLHGHPWEGVLVGNGSNELLSVVLDAVAGPGQEVVGAVPTFGLYGMMIRRSGGEPRFLGPRPDARLPLDEIAAEVEREPSRPVLLCAPNNPTGEGVAVEWVEGVLKRLRAPLILDNAYGEFAAQDYRPLLARYPHLVLMRTFSKAWSLAGLRLGYLLAHPDLVGELIKIKLPYNLGWGGAAAALEALAAEPLVARRVRTLLGRRPQWTAMLAQRGFEVFPSETNFLLARCPGGAAGEIYRGLAERGILVRNVSGYPALAGCLRLSVGSGTALRATAAALDELLPTLAPQEEIR